MSIQAVESYIDPKVTSAQAAFRAVMNALARPGCVQHVAAVIDAPQPMNAATAALAQSLFDHDTPLWLDPAMRNQDVMQWLRFHTSAPITDAPDQGAFALISDTAALPRIESFAFGSADYPDRSTTLIVQVDALDAGPAWQLRGPGIDGATTIRADHSLRDLLTSLAVNAQTFPRGIDVVLVSADTVLAIPRTTRIQPMEA